MDVEHFFECVFGLREWLDDTDLKSRMDAEQITDDEEKLLLEAWTTLMWIRTLDYVDSSKVTRHIYFRASADPRIL